MPDRIWFMIEPLDVTLFRDGRPFTAGESSFARTLFPPNPSTLAGALRTFIGREILGGRFAGLGDAKSAPFQIIGPVPVDGRARWLFPWPADLVPREKEPIPDESSENHVMYYRRVLQKFPAYFRRSHASPSHGLVFTEAPGNTQEPAEIRRYVDKTGRAWMDSDGLKAWLKGDLRYRVRSQPLTLMDLEHRPGIRTTPATGTIDPEGGAFFFVQMNRYEEGAGYVLGLERADCPRDLWDRIQGAMEGGRTRLLHLGGERRLASIRRLDAPPPGIPEGNETGGTLRVLLLTPACLAPIDFRSLKVTFPSVSPTPNGDILALALTGEDRRLTGWDYKTNAPKSRHRLIPPGSVLVISLTDGMSMSSSGWLGEYTRLGYGKYVGFPEPADGENGNENNAKKAMITGG